MLNPLRDFPYLRAGYRKGLAKGEARGLAKGEARGLATGKAESVLLLLGSRGLAVSPELRMQILGCTDLVRLERWLHAALTARSADEILSAG
jgi:hypothetical protein